ncbi:protein NO VEIN domain-containing protein [Arthrobacter sp. NPDC056493]|uniref:protein NO VEIN domain-containing protein n=1 Tax=Arthrobacter sp. NPDC056493 TaxID=3345839 RepID=UPI00366F3DD5
MVINIKLSNRTIAEGDDPLGRDWYGYDSAATPEELWAHNRGDYFLNPKSIAGQRWAALNYEGHVVLVAELHDPDYEVLEVKTGRPKKALIGHVLAEGHPIYKALVGTQIEYPRGSRNAILYGPDPETAEASRLDLPEEQDQPVARGQGLQMDSEVRKALEDAAQDRLMCHYRDRGWTVTDTRWNRPYDAHADRGGERIYLEAKGTQSRGESVIVTRNEVDHARQHPGLCWMGGVVRNAIHGRNGGSWRGIL